MAIKILIPYNFNKNDEKSIDFVAHRYTKRKEIEMALFYTFAPDSEINTHNAPSWRFKAYFGVDLITCSIRH